MVHKNDPAAWADAIIDLLGDESRRRAMAAAGLTKSEAYAWPRIADQVIGVYQRVLGC